MPNAVAIGCLGGATVLLVILSVIDLRVRLLPNIYVLPFAILGIVFHLATDQQFLTLLAAVCGGALGFGLLYSIRFAANFYYKQDTLGLGDVKLLGAAGLWLGMEGVMLAMTLGATAGMIHGVGQGAYNHYVKKEPFDLSRLQIPAGPGFAVGIVLAALYMFRS